jgi:hypothetical protein
MQNTVYFDNFRALSLCYTELNGETIDELWIGKDLEGIALAIIVVYLAEFAWKD